MSFQLPDNSNKQPQQQPQQLSLTLEHALGYNGTIPHSTIIHPNLKNYIYIAGSVIVIAEMNDANIQEFLRGHDDEITSLALSNKGNLIASGQKGDNSDLIIWDFESRRILYQLYEHDYRIDILKFSQDDKLLYSSGNIDDKKLIIWDTSNAYIISNSICFPEKVKAMAWGYKIRDDRNKETSLYQFSTCGGNMIYLWSLDAYKGQLENTSLQTGNFTREYISLSYSINDQKYLYAGTTSGDIVCFLIKNRMIVFNKIICAKGITSIIPITSNQIIIGGGNGSLNLCYIEEPSIEVLTSIKLFGGIYSIAPSDDGVQLIASTDKGFIYRIRSSDLSNILLNENHTSGIISCSKIIMNKYMTHDFVMSQTYDKSSNHTDNDCNTYFGTTSFDGTIRLWDLSSYSVYFRLFLSHSLVPNCIYFTEDVLYSGWNDGKMRAYDIRPSITSKSNSIMSYDSLWKIDNVHKNGVTSLTGSKNQKFLCTGGENGEVRVWEVKSQEMISNLKEHNSKVTKIELMENDNFLLTSAKDRSILIWDLNKEQRISNYQLPMGGVNSFTLSRLNRNMLFTVGQERKIYQWDLRSPKPVRVLNSNPYGRSDVADELFAVCLSNKEDVLVTGGTNGIIRCYDTSSMSFIGEKYGHSDTCTNIIFSNDDRRIISTGNDSQILTFKI